MTDRRYGPALLRAKESVARETWVLRYDFEMGSVALPGQFAMVHPGCDELFVLPRPLSILDAGDGWIDFLVKVAGRGSRALVEADLGSAVRILAPLGRGFDLDSLACETLILVAGGVGVVPLHLAARRLVERGRPARRAIFGARAPEDLPRQVWSDGRGGDWELWVQEGAEEGDLHPGLVTEGLERALVDAADATILACGPTAMMQAVVRIGRRTGNRVWLCLEEQMGCGAGVCRACVVDLSGDPGQRVTVCREGPVFESSEIRFLAEETPA